MSQKTNLNSSPYYDDFDSGKNFHRVLFKPGFPVQSRELTTLQSILQDQVEKFGSHFFKEGSAVISGGVRYESQYYAVKVKSVVSGINISLYLNNLVGKEIKGQDSQVTAKIRSVLPASESDEGYNTLYVKYDQGNSSFEFQPFIDSEGLVVQESVVYGNTTIASGDLVAECIDFSATAIGSSYSISDSVYFIRGHFVNILGQELILDQYTNTPSYRIGLEISEEIITAKDDNTLYDNAKGFSNYAAPGSDRLKITAKLSKKLISDFDDKNFIEIERVNNGTIITRNEPTNNYNILEDYFAKRTFEESGNYSVKNYNIELQESLNDRVSSNGLYLNTELTLDGNTPSEDLSILKISPGTSYVEGYKIDTQSTYIDVEKPRETSQSTQTSVPFEMGNLLKVNNVSGTPIIGINNNSYLNLQSRRKESTIAGAGTTIGQARVYNFSPSETYENTSSQWDLYLFDIQTYTILTLNDAASLTASTNIKGRSSGASGYVVSVNGQEVTLNQTSGSFLQGEQILINGTTETSRSIKSIKIYDVSDIKSVYQNTEVLSGFSTDFVADSVLEKQIGNNFSIVDTLEINGGIATCPGKSFVGIKSDTIIRYQRSGIDSETFNRVESVSDDGSSITLSGLSTVSNVCDGAIANGQSVTFSFGFPTISNKQNASLFTELPASNIAEVNFLNSNINISKQITSKSTDSSGRLTVSLSDVGISSAFFDAFDEEKYSIIYSDGSIEPLSSDQFSLQNNIVTFKGLRTSQSSVTVNTSLKKSSIVNKLKTLDRSQKTSIAFTRSGISTSYGLTSNPYYGLRVEDDEICLNTTDVLKLLAIYESIDGAAPVLDTLSFNSSLGLDTNSILGEQVIGKTSNAVGQIVTRKSTSEIEIVYLNDQKFDPGETVLFKESLIESPISSITIGQYINRIGDYTLDNGQKDEYYGYSKIVRKFGVRSPSRRLLVIFDKYTSTGSMGDVFTISSYDTGLENIPLNSSGVRLSDLLDFRPRVSDFNVVTATRSPFDFLSRDFSATSFEVISPNESSTLFYSNYLPRIDKLVLDKQGKFRLIKGNPEINPSEPSNRFGGMEIASIELPAYLFNSRDAKISLIDNARFTMKDIGRIRDRVENLERVTSLSLLELDTKSLQIKDNDGFSKFKSGFVVDDFKDLSLVNISDPDNNIIIDINNNQLVTDRDEFSLKSILAPAQSLNLNTLDYNTDYELFDSNLKKTGDVVTLDYVEEEWGVLTQPLATRVSNVNPFNVISTTGTITLSPRNDTWTRTIVVQGAARTNWIAWWSGAETFENRLTSELINRTADPFMRSRNVEFQSASLPSLTRFYSSLDSNSQVDIIPKLLEISMVSGVFQVGETVQGFVGDQKIITFRVATQSHKRGPYNATINDEGAQFYTYNPYDNPNLVPLSGYNSASTVLNVDISSLAEEAVGEFNGRVEVGMTLIGTTSGAEATLTRNRLISDYEGHILGSFFIRDPNQSPQPSVRITTGEKTFKLSSNINSSEVLPEGYVVSTAEGNYTSEGTVQTIQEFLLTVRRQAPPPPPPPPPPPVNWGDPLAQSFAVTDDSGYISSIDLWFYQKDTFQPVILELRTMELGLPTTQLVSNNSVIEILPEDIVVSTDGRNSAFTRATFPSPVYVERGQSYAIVLLSPYSNNHYVWTAKMGESTSETKNLPDSETVIYSRQYIGGTLFKSQNGVTWSADQLEDMKFRVNRCRFTSTEGTAYFYNPSLQRTSLKRDFNSPSTYSTENNPITVYPRKLNVGLQTTFDSGSILTVGRKVGTDGSSTTGIIEQVGGEILTTTLTNVGVGYSVGSYSNVPLYNISGSGSGALANIVINSSGELSSLSIASSGIGYVQGDVLGLTTSNVEKGSGASITVASTRGINMLYLTDVVGETFYPNGTTALSYYNGNTAVSLGSTYTTSSVVSEEIYSGNVFEVYDHSHGMHASNNSVKIFGVEPTTVGVKLSQDLVADSNTLTVDNVGIFTTFEGQPVGSGLNESTGYLLVGNEIIEYNNYNESANTITINAREIDSTITRKHLAGSIVYKYELNGVSLRRINKNHTMTTNSNTINSNKTIDSYQMQFDRSSRTSGDNLLSFADERKVGGNECILSQNIQYNSILPFFDVFSPANTAIESSIRTVSATSASGSEVSFQDIGYIPLQLNTTNELNSTRMIASHINETDNLSSLPNNKSLTIAINMQGTTYASPMINISSYANINLFRNRVDLPVRDYVNDSRTNQLSGDPHSSVYITKKITLKNPATSLKVLLSAYKDSSADFRVLYRLFKSDSSEIDQTYELFPGYDNLNSGRPDTFVRSSLDNEFLDYEFTADNVSEYDGFVIKIVMSGTNESKPIRIKDFRAIALS